jgi:hypothetical protein
MRTLILIPIADWGPTPPPSHVPLDKDIARHDEWLYYLFMASGPLLVLLLLTALLLWWFFKRQKAYPKPEKIYIPLLNWGTPVVRRTRGTKVGDNVYRVLPTKDYDAASEKWQFPPGTIVTCEAESWNGNEVLVAKRALASESPLP